MRHLNEYTLYKVPEVRAMVWCLISPGLVGETAGYASRLSNHWCEQIYYKIKSSFLSLDQNPAELTEWLNRFHSPRLGIRFEAFWAFILKLLNKEGYIHHFEDHVQIVDQFKQTQGEMDFVYLNNKNHFNHLEVAVKFYLLKPDQQGYERLPGPNANDWYERKLKHLFNKQLSLSQETGAREKINNLFAQHGFSLNSDRVCHQQGVIKGMIFTPLAETDISLELFSKTERKILADDCLQGHWLSMNNLPLLDSEPATRWMVLEKFNWLVPQIFSSQQTLYDLPQLSRKLKKHFMQTSSSIMLASLIYDQRRRLWIEKQRLMVVHDLWPET